MEQMAKSFCMVCGGLIGWFVGKFSPTFPLMFAAIAFIIYDSWTAFELDRRVKKVYPDKHLRPAKFASYKFWNVIPTMIESLVVIILAYIAQRWIFVDVYVPASYIATGVIAAGQVVSICENKCSCRLPNDRHYRIWKALAKVFIDKTERHFDTDLSDLKKILNEEKEDEK